MLDRTMDAYIDAVARQMTAGRPRADLRRLVVSRIAAAQTPRPGRSRLAWQASLATVAVIAVVLAVAIITYIRRVPVPASPVAGAPPAQSRHEMLVKKTPAHPSSALPTRRRSNVRVQPSEAVRSEPIARLHVDPIAVQPIVQSPIDVPQNPLPNAIALTPLSISPLSPEGEK